MPYQCEYCHDTGWYGDRGPGRRGNHEFVPCDQCDAHQKPICALCDKAKQGMSLITIDESPIWVCRDCQLRLITAALDKIKD